MSQTPKAGNHTENTPHPYNAEKWKKQLEDVIQAGPYSDTWESLMQHETPAWFRDAKFGIFIHWGVYSVPAFANEWYPRNMYVQGTREFQHHAETYGPHDQFGYKDYIPLFKAEKFDPAAWCTLFKQAGARFVVPVAEHHDGFQMYKSELSDWNAYKMGPHRDITGELTEAIRDAGMVNGASTHRIEHWFFLNHGREFASDVAEHADERTHLYWPSMPVPDELITGDSQAQPEPSREYLEDWMYRTLEIIDRFHPKELYFDWWIMHRAARPYLKKIAAYYYNRAASWGEEVLLINKMGAFMYGTATRDMERGQLETIQEEPWQTDTAIARNSWCYTEENIYKSAPAILRDLVDAVSKNGSMLLNVGPKADGTIADEDTAILTGIGRWLSVNGDAIYGSRPFRIAGEGPTEPKKGAFSDMEDTPYTSQDFRFTINHGKLYAIALRPSENGQYTIHALADKGKDTSQSDLNAIIGQVETLDPAVRILFWKQTREGLVIQTEPYCADTPVSFCISLE